MVALIDSEGREFARGITVYDAEALNAIAGVRTEEIHGRLGYRILDEAVHRDSLVVIT